MSTLEEQITAANADLAQAMTRLEQAESSGQPIEGIVAWVTAVNNRLAALTAELTRRSSLSGKSQENYPSFFFPIDYLFLLILSASFPVTNTIQ